MAELTDSILKRFNKARLVGGAVRTSLTFNIRHKAWKKRFPPRQLKTIIVDMDGTIFKTDSSYEALKIMYPDLTDEKEILGEFIYRKILQHIFEGSQSIEDAIITGTEFLMDAGFHKSDFERVLNMVKGQLRENLIYALKSIKEKQDVKIVLASLSSVEFGKLLNEHLKEKYGFSFDGIIGTVMKFDEEGKLTGLKRIIGTKSGTIDGIKVTTKMSAVRKILKEARWEFDEQSSVLITDSYGDVDLSKKIPTILIKPSDKSTAVQMVSHLLRLGDMIVEDNEFLKEKIEAELSVQNETVS
jgi:hypothetical protein